MKNILVFFILLFNLSAVYGQSQEDSKRLEAFKRQVNTPVFFKNKFTRKIKNQKDILYEPKQNSKMDIYFPGSNENKPLVILIHGKTPIETAPKDWGVYESWGKILATEGFVCVTFNNSLAIPGKTLITALDDLKAVVDFLKSKTSIYHIDTSKIALFSFSAGSPLLTYPFVKNDSNVKAMISFYGFLNIESTPLYGEVSNTIRNIFSLNNYLQERKDFPPIFIAEAGKETNTGLNQSIEKFLLEASANKIPVTFFNHPDGFHGFDNQNNDPRTREIIQAMLNFLHAHLDSD